MSRPAIYRVLENPWVYRLVQMVLAPGSRALEAKYLPQINLDENGWLLDVGCGPGTGTPRGSWRVVGVDPNPDYIRQLTGGFVDEDGQEIFSQGNNRRIFGFASSAGRLPFADNSFDLVRCSRVIHHFPPDLVRDAVREMVRVAKPGGQVLIVDPIYPQRAWKRPIAWGLLKLDRGEFVRRREQLTDLIREAAPCAWDVRVVPCSLLGVQSLVLQYHKAAESIRGKLAA